jgi:hypothetical protein
MAMPQGVRLKDKPEKPSLPLRHKGMEDFQLHLKDLPPELTVPPQGKAIRSIWSAVLFCYEQRQYWDWRQTIMTTTIMTMITTVTRQV